MLGIVGKRFSISWLNPHAAPPHVPTVPGAVGRAAPVWEKGFCGDFVGILCGSCWDTAALKRGWNGESHQGGAGQSRAVVMKSCVEAIPPKHGCSCSALQPRPVSCVRNVRAPSPNSPEAPRGSPTLLPLFLWSLMPFLVPFCSFFVSVCFVFLSSGFPGGREDGE